MQASADEQETLLRKVSLLGAGLGLGTTVHLVPFQDSMSVVATGKPKFPTAVQARADRQETPVRALPPPLGCGPLGLGTMDHLVPFQDSTRVLVTVLLR